MHPVLAHISDLSPNWLTAALQEAGFTATVREVEVQSIGTGQMASSYRIRPAYEGDRGSAPETMVAKLAAGDPASRQRVADGFRKEVGFYAELARTVDARVPQCWHWAITEDGTDFTLLLEDIHAARAGVQVDGCSIDHAKSAVVNLAALHAPRWNDAALFELAFVVQPDEAGAAFLGDILTTATEQFIERFDRPRRTVLELLTIGRRNGLAQTRDAGRVIAFVVLNRALESGCHDRALFEFHGRDGVVPVGRHSLRRGARRVGGLRCRRP